MSILDKVVKIEKRLEKLAARKDAPATAIEIRRAILDDVEAQVRPAGRSRKVFPYDRVAIEVLGRGGARGDVGVAPTSSAGPSRAELEAVLSPDEGLTDAIRERLEEAGCERVGRLNVSVKVLKKARADWAPGLVFAVAYERTAAAPGATPSGATSSPVGPSTLREPQGRPELRRGATGSGRTASKAASAARSDLSSADPKARASDAPVAQLVVLEGEATKKTFTLTGERTNIGRQPQVADKHERIVRRNQVIFADTDTEANQTVSRAQAHIRFTPPDEYRLYDDHSSYGTRIVREGKMIELPSGSPRGVRLRAGDEIYFGKARVVFQVK